MYGGRDTPKDRTVMGITLFRNEAGFAVFSTNRRRKPPRIIVYYRTQYSTRLREIYDAFQRFIREFEDKDPLGDPQIDRPMC